MRHLLLQLGLFAFVVSASIFSSQEALAYIELNGFYYSDTLTATGANQAASRMLIDASIGFSIDKGGRYLAGWNYSIDTTSDTTGTNTYAYSSTQMGPRFIFMIDKDHRWCLGLTYNLVTSATYSATGGTSYTWTGTDYKVDAGYNFPTESGIVIGAKLNYSLASYTSQLVGSSTYSTISYSKTLMYPSVSLFYGF
jgi:hypothetical protein